jgi:putative transposase
MDISRFNGLPSTPMSVHSYSRCWVHLIWGTLNRERLLNKEAAAALSRYLSEYADTKGVYMKINYVNADHVHTLIDLPTNLSIEELIQQLKGSSSHWVNANNILAGKFAWGRGYGAFSVSESNVAQVAAYIAAQEEHHRVRTFAEELREFIERHGLRWQDGKAVETAYVHRGGGHTGLKAGVNERQRLAMSRIPQRNL